VTGDPRSILRRPERNPIFYDMLGAWALSPVTLATQCLTNFMLPLPATIGAQSAPWLELAAIKLDGAAHANSKR
jgi:hypothetical protein